MGHAAVAQRGPTGAIADDDRMLGASHLLVVQGHVLHQLGGVDTLLITHADQIVESEPSQGDHRRAIESRIIEPIEEVDGAGTCGSQAYAQTSGVLGKAGGHEGCSLFVPDADIANPVLALAQRFNDRIDAIADDAERMRGAPGDQGIDQDIGSGLIAPERRSRLRGYG